MLQATEDNQLTPGCATGQDKGCKDKLTLVLNNVVPLIRNALFQFFGRSGSEDNEAPVSGHHFSERGPVPSVFGHGGSREPVAFQPRSLESVG